MTSTNPVLVTQLFGLLGDQVRLVGGCVRDMLLNQSPKDWDMNTTIPPEELLDFLTSKGFKAFDMSNGHGTITVVQDDTTVEITTLRRDVETDGRHAQVEFVSDWREDALRRDFTYNALMIDQHGVIYDYFNGVEDLNERITRFIGNPEDRITEDYLRILRYFRFAARMGSFSTFKEYRPLFEKHGPMLTTLSGERIWSEMQKILTGPLPLNTQRLLSVCSITERLLQI